MTPKAKVAKAASTRISPRGSSRASSVESTPTTVPQVMKVHKPSSARKSGDRMSKKAGLQFNVSKMHQKLKKGHYAKIVHKGAAVYMVAAIEYMVAEVLELSGEMALRRKHKRITPRDIMMAIRTDEELNKLVGKVDFSDGGIIPHIHSVLLPKPTARRRSSSMMETQSASVQETNTESY